MSNSKKFENAALNKRGTDVLKHFFINTPDLQDDDRRVVLHLLDQTQNLTKSVVLDLSKCPEIAARMEKSIYDMTVAPTESYNTYDSFMANNALDCDIFIGRFHKSDNSYVDGLYARENEESYVKLWFAVNKQTGDQHAPTPGSIELILEKDDFHDIPLPHEINPNQQSPQQKFDDLTKD